VNFQEVKTKEAWMGQLSTAMRMTSTLGWRSKLHQKAYVPWAALSNNHTQLGATETDAPAESVTRLA
jgi:hypothetical protein